MTKYLLYTGIVFVWGCSSTTNSNNEESTVLIEAAETTVDAPLQQDTLNTSTKEILPQSPRLSGKYTITPIFTDSIGWGYTISAGEKIIVKQPHIPAVAGLQGFSSEAKARRAGEEVAYKLEQGIMPPSLTIEEMKSLRVLD